MGVTTFDFQQDLWHWKTGVAWLSYLLVREPSLAVLVEEDRHVTDRRTDTRANGHIIYRASITSHGKSVAISLAILNMKRIAILLPTVFATISRMCFSCLYA